MNISVGVLYEQLKEQINSATIKAHTESNLPAFMVVAALKEILCKYETDSMSALVHDYQSLMSEMSNSKEGVECKEPTHQE